MEHSFIKVTLSEFKKYKNMGDKVFDQLTTDEMNYAPDDYTNSIAVNITHMSGNMISRWTNFLQEDGEKEWRRRDEEFEVRNLSKETLLTIWEEGWQKLFITMESLKENDLNKTVYIRNQPHSVMEAVLRQLTHYVSHVGQIILLGKHIKRENWQTLSIPKGESKAFNKQLSINK